MSPEPPYFLATTLADWAHKAWCTMVISCRPHHLGPWLASLVSALEWIEQFPESEQERIRDRVRRQISRTEANFLLCFALFESDSMAAQFRKLAEKYALFADYKPGLDPLEHVMLALAKGEKTLDKVATGGRTIHRLAAEAFAGKSTA
ncbi:MAG: hypothetical protein NZ533_11130 [Casimicrobiaceae bacterium]|nr:hypothetical protein [Casimicrobiaceae bacterium]